MHLRATPFHEGVWACGRRQVSWLPGLPLSAFPARVAVPVAALHLARAAASPGHSGGSAPDSHRLPFTTDLERAGVYLRYEPWNEYGMCCGTSARAISSK